jgi:hypothetical protein
MTKIVHHNSYLSSPLVYSVRTCLEYDSLNWYMREDDANEREICRIDFQYEGIWAEGTKFYYKCAKSEVRSYKQSIEYDIRWFMEIEIDNKLTRRQVLRETKAVPRCSA